MGELNSDVLEKRHRWALLEGDVWRCMWPTDDESTPCRSPLTDSDVAYCPEHEAIRFARWTAKFEREFRPRLIRELEEAIDKLPIWRELPDMPFARTERPEFKTKASKLIQKVAVGYDPERHGSLLILGPPGTWKTAATVALVHRFRAEAIERARSSAPSEPFKPVLRGDWFMDEFCGNPSADSNRLFGATFLPAIRVVIAQREHPLGQGAAPAIKRAKSAGLLVLDELGPQAAVDRDGVMMDILDHRYRNRLPTVATSGMSVADFKEAHGGGLWRRLTEENVGRLIDLHEMGGRE